MPEIFFTGNHADLQAVESSGGNRRWRSSHSSLTLTRRCVVRFWHVCAIQSINQCQIQLVVKRIWPSSQSSCLWNATLTLFQNSTKTRLATADVADNIIIKILAKL
jgi:hypothetical protein